jgi:hypothetical protein
MEEVLVKVRMAPFQLTERKWEKEEGRIEGTQPGIF